MINNPVIIIRVIIVFHTSQKVVHPGTVEKRYKVSNTGIKELHPSKLPDIRSNHKGIHEFLICPSHKLFKHHAANNHIYRSIWAGSFITIKDRKIFFVDQGEYFFSKRFCPGFFY
jgi:hypothetical protein